MLPTATLTTAVLASVTILVLAGAVWVVTLANLFRAALSLGIVLLGVAGLFLVLEAEFLAFVQILVYVGAVLTLVVFAIMLTARLHVSPSGPPRRQPIAAAVASLGLFVVLAVTTQSVVWPQLAAAEAVTLPALGQHLITTLVLPFELISLVFVAAIVGAITLATPPARLDGLPGRARPPESPPA